MRKDVTVVEFCGTSFSTDIPAHIENLYGNLFRIVYICFFFLSFPIMEIGNVPDDRKAIF